eukprot:1261601-Karenia_brevis.AAC.1
MRRPWQHNRQNGCISMPGDVPTFLDWCLHAWTSQYRSIMDQVHTTSNMVYTLGALAEFQVSKVMKKMQRN